MGLEETTSGIVKLDGKIILLLDYEKIVCEISGTGYDNKSLSKLEQKQIAVKKLFILRKIQQCFVKY